MQNEGLSVGKKRQLAKADLCLWLRGHTFSQGS